MVAWKAFFASTYRGGLFKRILEGFLIDGTCSFCWVMWCRPVRKNEARLCGRIVKKFLERIGTAFSLVKVLPEKLRRFSSCPKSLSLVTDVACGLRVLTRTIRVELFVRLLSHRRLLFIYLGLMPPKTSCLQYLHPKYSKI